MTEEIIAEKGGAKADWGNLVSFLYQFALFKRNDKLRCREIMTSNQFGALPETPPLGDNLVIPLTGFGRNVFVLAGKELASICCTCWTCLWSCAP